LTHTTHIIKEGQAALKRQTSSANWEDGKAIMHALALGRSRAMHETRRNTPRGYKYCQQMGVWLQVYGFDVIDKGARARFLECFDHLDEIDAWREGRSPREKFKLNYPPTVLRAWRLDLNKKKPAVAENVSNPPDEPAKQQLDLAAYTDAQVTAALAAYTFERFLRVQPPEWRSKTQKQARAQAISDVKKRRPNARVRDLNPRFEVVVDNTEVTH
jgi:hypothetical protein